MQINHVLNLCSVEVAACFPLDALIHLQLAKAIPKTRSYDGLKRLLVLMTKNTETRMFEMKCWKKCHGSSLTTLTRVRYLSLCVCVFVCVCVCVCVKQ